MADLSILVLFFVLYSSVVVSSLWLTVSQRMQVARELAPPEKYRRN